MTEIKPKRPQKLARCLMFLVVIVSAVACANRAGDAVDKQANVDQQIRDLLQRPDIGDAVSRYERMRTEIRDRLTAEVGVGSWKNDNEGSASGCNQFPDVAYEEKESRGLSIWYLDEPIPDDKWPQAVVIFSEITSKYGFESPPRKLVDRPGNHEVTAADAWGADVTFGSKLAASIGLLTGCHLTATGRSRHAATSSSGAPT